MVHHPDGAAEQARVLADAFGPRRAAAAIWLGLKPTGRPHIHLVNDHAGMVRHIGPKTPEWAVAVVRDDDVMAFRLDRVGRSRENSIELVLRHEVVHQVLNHLGRGKLPRWFEEGLCVYFAGVPFIRSDYSVERLAAGGGLPALEEAERGFHSDKATAARSYKVAHSAVSYFVDRFTRGQLRGLLQRVGRGEAFSVAFVAATQVPLAVFESEWRAAVTPSMPFFLFVMLENLEVTLLSFAALLVVAGYIRVRLRREKAMQSLGE